MVRYPYQGLPVVPMFPKSENTWLGHIWWLYNERVKNWFFCVMKWARDMDIPMDVPLVDEH